MRINNINSWQYSKSLNTMLFFAQRMDELLFHHSTDSYRYPVLSIIGLCDEYICVYKDIEDGLINEKNLSHIVDEIAALLKEDSVAINILSSKYKDRFVKSIGLWNKHQTYENILFVRRKLGGNKYYYHVVELLRSNIRKNSEKRLVDKYAGILIRLLIDAGYNETYIYGCLHDVFFHQLVNSTDSFDVFISKFTFGLKKYDVYIGYSYDLSQLVPLFQRMKAENVVISCVDLTNLPTGIRAKGQKTILKFENVQGLDVYSAYEFVRTISRFIINAYGYYSHIKNGIKEYGQVVDENNRIQTISNQDLLKYRVSSLSHEELQTNAEGLLNVLFSTYQNMDEISRITAIHNSAICSENTSDSLLSLWSIAESLSGDMDADKIVRVKESMLPFLKSTYIEKLVNTCMMDIRRWNQDFFYRIKEESSCEDDLEATFAFLVLEEMDEMRKKLYELTELFPLLRYRVYFLNAQLQNSKGFTALILAHKNRVEWQLHRIYRARNYIIHDGRRGDKHNSELVINLHSYIDIMFTKIIELLSQSPYSDDSISDIIIEHRLKTSIMDERLKEKGKTKLNRSELRFYLYYDYER